MIDRLRSEFGDTKDIWSWSGYTFEELLLDSEDKLEMLSKIDILVDGRFELSKKNLMLQFRGSSNQRIIDVKNHWQKAKWSSGKSFMIQKKPLNKSKERSNLIALPIMVTQYFHRRRDLDWSG